MIRKLVCIILVQFFAVQLWAQNEHVVDFPQKFIGYGWVVVFSYDVAFIPYIGNEKFPCLKYYFKQKNKEGIRINQFWSTRIHHDIGERKVITTMEGEESEIIVIPVIAYYNIQYFDYSNLKFENKNAELRKYDEMLQKYKFKGDLETVKYRFGMNIDFQYKILDQVPE